MLRLHRRKKIACEPKPWSGEGNSKLYQNQTDCRNPFFHNKSENTKHDTPPNRTPLRHHWRPVRCYAAPKVLLMWPRRTPKVQKVSSKRQHPQALSWRTARSASNKIISGGLPAPQDNPYVLYVEGSMSYTSKVPSPQHTHTHTHTIFWRFITCRGIR